MNRLRTVKLYQDAKRKIVVIESVELRQHQFDRGGQVYASITPLAIVVCHSEGNAVFAVDAEDTSLEALKQNHPELDECIRRSCGERQQMA